MHFDQLFCILFLRTKFKLSFIFFFMCIYVCHMHAGFHRRLEKSQIFWNWSFQWFVSQLLWVLGTEPGANKSSTHSEVLSPLSSPKNRSFAVYFTGHRKDKLPVHSSIAQKSLDLRWGSIALQSKALVLVCEDRVQMIKGCVFKY